MGDIADHLVLQFQALVETVQANDGLDNPTHIATIMVSQCLVNTTRDTARTQDDTFWDKLVEANVQTSLLARVLSALINHGSKVNSFRAAALVAALLKTPGCPVVSLLTESSLTAIMRTLQRTRAAAGNRQGKGSGKGRTAKATQVAQDDSDEEATADMETEDAAAADEGGAAVCGVATAVDVLGSVADALQRLQTIDNADTLSNLCEAIITLIHSPGLPGEVVEGAFGVLRALCLPQGPPASSSAMMEEDAALDAPCTALRLLSTHMLRKEAGVHKTAAWAHAVVFLQHVLSNASPSSAAAVTGFLKNILLRCPDKADVRTALCVLCRQLARQLQPPALEGLMIFLYRLSRSGKVAQRLLAVEVAGDLLDSCKPLGSHEPLVTIYKTTEANMLRRATPTPARLRSAAESQRASLGLSAVCLSILWPRAADKAPAVRAKALTGMSIWFTALTTASTTLTAVEVAQLLADAQQLQVQEWAEVHACPVPGVREVDAGADTAAAAASTGMADSASRPAGDANFQPEHGTADTVANAVAAAPVAVQYRIVADVSSAVQRQVSLATVTAPFLATARVRCTDEKGPVRKAALQLMESLLLARAYLDQQLQPAVADVQAIQSAICDPLVTVRRAALAAASSLLEQLQSAAGVPALLVQVVLPMVHDTESGIKDAAVQHFHALVLARIITIASGSRNAAAKAAEEVACLLAGLGTGGQQVAVNVAATCMLLAEKKLLKAKQLAKGLQSIIATDVQVQSSTAVAAGAWLLSSAVAVHDAHAMDWDFLMQQWKGRVKKAATQHTDSLSMLCSVCLLRTIAAAAEQSPTEGCQELKDELLQVAGSLTVPPPLMAAHVQALAKVSGTDDVSWATQLIAKAEHNLAAYVEAVGGGNTLSQMQRSAAIAANTDSGSANAALFAIGEAVSTGKVAPGSQVVVLVQALLSPGVTLTQAAAGAPAAVPCAVQAQAWSTLGKLCMVNGALAKRCAPVFVQEVLRNPWPAVRNNILVVLRDLCVHYTALVDGQMPRLLAATFDAHALVRKQALALLANLLQKDYMKWRGPVLHRFIVALVDDSPDVRQLGKFLLEDALMTKAFLLTYNHFIEALFSLNACSDKLAAVSEPLATQSSQPSQGSTVSLSQMLTTGGGGTEQLARCRLDGSEEAMRSKRLVVYQELLQRMSPEHKFSCSAKLCLDVLGGCIDGVLPLSSCSELIRDTMVVLACKEMQVSTASVTAAAEADAEEGGSQPAAVAARMDAAKGKLMSSMMRKHLLEQVVPILVELHRILAAQRHPLMGSLMQAAAALLKEHKNELEEILVGHRQLAKELLYDMQQAEQAEKLAQQQAKAAAAAAAADKTQAAALRTQVAVGVDCRTPIAAEVLAASMAAVASAGARGRSGSRGPAAPGEVSGRATPRGSGPLRVGSYSTPRAAGAGSAGAGPSRLGQSGQPSTGGTHKSGDTPGSISGSELSVPRLRVAKGRSRTGPSRLKQASNHDHQPVADPGVEGEKNAGDGVEGTRQEHDAGGADVVLPRPQPHSTAKTWNVAVPPALADDAPEADGAGHLGVKQEPAGPGAQPLADATGGTENRPGQAKQGKRASGRRGRAGDKQPLANAEKGHSGAEGEQQAPHVAESTGARGKRRVTAAAAAGGSKGTAVQAGQQRSGRKRK